MVERILVTGGSGRIGRKLIGRLGELLNTDGEVHLLRNRSELPEMSEDFFRAGIVSELGTGRYDLAFHLAANTDTAYCERPENREDVWRVNVDLTKQVCHVSDRVVITSTDRVFGADKKSEYYEDDERSPNSVYGESKAAAEKVVLEEGGNVIRVQQMLGASRIVDAVLDPEMRKNYYPFFENDFLRPSYFDDFFSVIKEVNRNGKAGGIYHVSCDGEVPSRCDIASEVLRICDKKGFDVDRMGFKYGRMEEDRRIVLNSVKTSGELGVVFTDWREALEKDLKERFNLS